MQVTILTPLQAFEAGKVYDIPEDKARALIAKGHAEARFEGFEETPNKREIHRSPPVANPKGKQYVHMTLDEGKLKAGTITSVNDSEAQALFARKSALPTAGNLFKAAISGPGGTHGGYTVPNELWGAFQFALYDSPFMRLGNPVSAFGAAEVSMPIPYVDPTASANINFFGQYSASWTSEEATSLVSSEPKFAELRLPQRILNSISYLSNTFVKDSNWADTMFDRHVLNSIKWQLDRSFLLGKGIIEPLGALYHPLKIAIARSESNSVTFTDIGKMMGRLLCNDWTRAFFVASPGILDKLPALTPLFKGQDGQFSLAGISLSFHQALPDLGTLGDLCLFSGEYALIPFFQMPKVQRSEHPGFVQNQQTYKAQTRLNMDWMINQPITQANQDSLSPIIALDVKP